MPKSIKTKNKKRAKVYKNSVADSLTETIILSAFFLPHGIIYYRANKNRIEHTKSTKKPFLPYILIL